MKYSFLFFILFLSTWIFSQTVNQTKLAELITKARTTKSDGLVIIQNDKVLIDESFGTPVTPTYIASVGKALVSIAIVKLLNDGKITSIDQPISDFYPEWKQGQKRFITLRMILSHTSGMQNEKNTRLEIETGSQGSGDDLVKLALAAEITSRPGTAYEYNNKAICLLPGIIETASGMRMDKFFEETFFKPMEIKNFEWTRDGTGRPQGHAGFRLLARDLAKFGQLMASGGVYKGKRFFEQRWVDSSIASSQAVNPQIGLAWHRYSGRDSVIYFYVDSAQLEFFRNHGMADSIINQLKPIINEPFYNADQFSARMKDIFGANWKQIMASATKSFPNGERDFWKAKKIEGELKGYYHSGSWGNYLVIVPELKLVAVRVVKRDEEYNRDTDLFGEFVSRAFELTR